MEAWGGAGGRSININTEELVNHGGARTIAQEAMPGSQMSRILVIGGRCTIVTVMVVVDALGLVRINKVRTAVLMTDAIVTKSKSSPRANHPAVASALLTWCR